MEKGNPDRMITRSCHNGQSGFTLAEVLVSMVIAAAAMMSISTLIVMSTRNTSKSRQITSASSLAEGLADSIRNTRRTDVGTTNWNLIAAYGTWVTDPTNPNPGYVREYRVDYPPAGAGQGPPVLQVTIRVTPLKTGGVAGKVYGQTGRNTDLVFFMRDPYTDPLTGIGSILSP